MSSILNGCCFEYLFMCVMCIPMLMMSYNNVMLQLLPAFGLEFTLVQCIKWPHSILNIPGPFKNKIKQKEIK